jgi:hypothetical protein
MRIDPKTAIEIKSDLRIATAKRGMFKRMSAKTVKSNITYLFESISYPTRM